MVEDLDEVLGRKFLARRPSCQRGFLRARTGSRLLSNEGGRWASPRVSMTDMLLMYDWNVWHRRSVILKGVLVGGLGWRLMEGGEVLYDPREHEDVPPRPSAA